MFVACYLVHVQPFTSPTINKQEIINEMTILFAAYTLYTYAGVTTGDRQTNYNIGWGHISILGTNMIINMLFVGYSSIHTSKLKLKRFKNRRIARARSKAAMKAQMLRSSQYTLDNTTPIRIKEAEAEEEGKEEVKQSMNE